MRLYDPAIGRFLARDMLRQAVALGKVTPEELLAEGIKLPLHPYSYVNGNPLQQVDPSGLQGLGFRAILQPVNPAVDNDGKTDYIRRAYKFRPSGSGAAAIWQNITITGKCYSKRDGRYGLAMLPFITTIREFFTIERVRVPERMAGEPLAQYQPYATTAPVNGVRYAEYIPHPDIHNISKTDEHALKLPAHVCYCYFTFSAKAFEVRNVKRHGVVVRPEDLPPYKEVSRESGLHPSGATPGWSYDAHDIINNPLQLKATYFWCREKNIKTVRNGVPIVLCVDHTAGAMPFSNEHYYALHKAETAK